MDYIYINFSLFTSLSIIIVIKISTTIQFFKIYKKNYLIIFHSILCKKKLRIFSFTLSKNYILRFLIYCNLVRAEIIHNNKI